MVFGVGESLSSRRSDSYILAQFRVIEQPWYSCGVVLYQTFRADSISSHQTPTTQCTPQCRDYQLHSSLAIQNDHEKNTWACRSSSGASRTVDLIDIGGGKRGRTDKAEL